jgi:signal transduction histidine kinase
MPIADDLRGAFVHMVMHSALLFGFALAFVLLLIHAMLAEREGRERLEAANHRLRTFARRIEDQAALEERNRIARDIHDSLGHSLTALNMQMEIALTLLTLAPERAQPYVADAKRLGSCALQAVRASVSALRTQPLSDRSLVEAVEELVRDCAQAADLKIDRTVAVDSALTAEVATTLYRIVQEAFTNICRHARATWVQVRIVEVSGAVELCIEDDGQGFDLAANTCGFGLAGMRERAGAVGGAITIESAPGAGCRIRGRFPLVEVPV